jgi:preprotein translocase subunit SecA
MRFEARGVAVTRLDARHDRDEHLSVARAGEAGRITVATQMAGRGTDIRPTPEALAAGGLHVLSLQHNRSARLDRQLAGRAARQGDPGSVEHWLRRTDCAFEPGRLPSPLRPLVRTVGVLATPKGSGRYGWAVAGVWRICQRWWRIEDRVTRTEALDHDRRWSRRLHFATIREF